MYQRNSQRNTRKKLFAALIALFILGNTLLVTPAFASPIGQRTPAGAHTCWPFWPFCWGTPTPTPTPAPGSTPTATPGKTSTPTPGKTGTPNPTGTPQPGSTPKPTPTLPPAGHLSDATTFTMKATQLVGTNAHLSLADPAFPVLTFSAVTIQGMEIVHLSVTLSASGTVTGTGLAIKTSLLAFASTAGSFTNPADLLILLAGGTVPTLTLRNVSLQVDHFVTAQSLTLNLLHVTE